MTETKPTRSDFPTLAHWWLWRINSGETVVLDEEMLAVSINHMIKADPRLHVEVRFEDGCAYLAAPRTAGVQAAMN